MRLIADSPEIYFAHVQKYCVPLLQFAENKRKSNKGNIAIRWSIHWIGHHQYIRTMPKKMERISSRTVDKQRLSNLSARIMEKYTF